MSKKLKNDKKVVLPAVKEDGEALIHASDELKNDKDVVLAAVTEKGYVFDDLANSMKKEVYKDKKAMKSVIEVQCEESSYPEICKGSKNALNFIGYYKLKALFY